MEAFIQDMIDILRSIVQNNNYFISIFIGMFVIVLESIVPFLPLALFISINMLVFGTVLGFFLSWIATIIGCSLSFFIFRFLQNHFHKLKQIPLIKAFNHITFSNLVIILSIPFTPAFSLNIGAGLSDMKYIKYLMTLFISKLFLVYFWGFIGTTLLESITDIGVLVKLCTMVIIAFCLSKWVTRYFCIE